MSSSPLHNASDKYGSLWTRDELVLALYLYCQIPFAKTKASNVEVKRLAGLVGRTPSSVARKLGNFGAFDPLLASQGISGLSHYSKADQGVWEEFNGRWDALVEEGQRLLTQLHEPASTDVTETSDEPEWFDIVQPTGPTQQPRLVMTRLYQSFFRRAVLSSYQNNCCVCGLDLPSLLVASHIVPWASREATRTDPQNGLCLCVLHDKAFDRGLITVHCTTYKIVTSPLLSASRALFTQTALTSFQHQFIRLSMRFSPHSNYLQWHNEHVFQAKG